MYGQREQWEHQTWQPRGANGDPRGAACWMDLDRWSAGRWSVRRTAAVDGSLRASDAERSQVADLLSQHYGQGRLDAAELDDRLGRAMKAKVRSELSELLTDLPPLATDAPVPERRPRRSLLLTIALWVLVIALATSVAATVHIPFLLLCIGVVLLWQRSRAHGWHRRRAEKAGAGS